MNSRKLLINSLIRISKRLAWPLVMLALLAACTSGGTASPPAGQESQEPSTGGSQESDAEESGDQEAAEEPSGEVMWYGTAPQTVMDEVAARFNETHDNITMVTLFNRGPELGQKVEAEIAAGRPVACVIMHPILGILKDFRERDMLLEYHSPEEAAYPDYFVEPGYWIGIRVLDVPLTYNTNLVTEEPTSWEVLTDPQYKGKIAFTDAGTIGGPPILTYKLLKEEYGPDFWPQVVANEPLILEQTGQVLDLTVNGEIAFGWMYGYNVIPVLEENPDAPIKPVWLAPTTVSAAFNAILKSCPNVEAAKVVYDWLASREGQQAIVDANRTISARDDVDLGPGRIPLSQMTWVPVDLDALAAEEEALKAEWRQVFGRE